MHAFLILDGVAVDRFSLMDRRARFRDVLPLESLL